jgi:hypothetical protein
MTYVDASSSIVVYVSTIWRLVFPLIVSLVAVMICYVVLILLRVRYICCYLVFNCCNVWNIALYMSICALFTCSVLLLILYVFHFSNIFPSFLPSYGAHCTGYTSICVMCSVYIEISWIIVIIHNCIYLLIIFDVKYSAPFLHMFQWVIWAFNLVNFTFFHVCLFVGVILLCFFCVFHIRNATFISSRARGTVVVRALCYKPEGRGF